MSFTKFVIVRKTSALQAKFGPQTNHFGSAIGSRACLLLVNIPGLASAGLFAEFAAKFLMAQPTATLFSVRPIDKFSRP